MPKIVIANGEPLEIGSVRKGLRAGPHGYGALPDQRFKVIAQSTVEDWIESVVAFGGPREIADIWATIGGPWYYYEIQTD